MEVLGVQFNNQDEATIIKQLCGELEVIPLSSDIVENVIDIKQAHKIKLPDAIIGATAIHYGFPLVTHNHSDFKKLTQSLRIIDPFS